VADASRLRLRFLIAPEQDPGETPRPRDSPPTSQASSRCLPALREGRLRQAGALRDCLTLGVLNSQLTKPQALLWPVSDRATRPQVSRVKSRAELETFGPVLWLGQETGHNNGTTDCSTSILRGRSTNAACRAVDASRPRFCSRRVCHKEAACRFATQTTKSPALLNQTDCRIN
jgi:hypothetical protein